MVHLYWVERGVQAGIWEWSIVEDNRRGRATGCDREGLDTEPTDKTLMSAAVSVRLDVALIPRHTKRGLRNLDDKEIKLRVGGQTLHNYVHDLDRPSGRYRNAAGGVWQACFGSA